MTYWANDGKHQLAYQILNKALVPQSGEAETPHGELLRQAANVYYDLYKQFLQNDDANGGGNLFDSHIDATNLLLANAYVLHRQVGGSEDGVCLARGNVDITGEDYDAVHRILRQLGDHLNSHESARNGWETADGPGLFVKEYAGTWEADLEVLMDAVLVYVASKFTESLKVKAGGAA